MHDIYGHIGSIPRHGASAVQVRISDALQSFCNRQEHKVTALLN
nr:MAG TPA: hypothetical protein [Caudoviricetes sp.]